MPIIRSVPPTYQFKVLQSIFFGIWKVVYFSTSQMFASLYEWRASLKCYEIPYILLMTSLKAESLLTDFQRQLCVFIFLSRSITDSLCTFYLTLVLTIPVITLSIPWESGFNAFYK